MASLSWPLSTNAFTSGLFQLLKVGGESKTSEQTTTTPANMRMDLVVEAETYTPHFYRGRAEPVAGAIMRLVALPEDTTAVVKYRWQVGGKTISEDSQTIRVTAPSGVNEVVVDVSALDKNGNVAGRTTNYVPLSTPSLSFYEVNPLRGVSAIAITSNLTLIGDEVTVHSEPYFINSLSLTNVIGEWNTGQLNNVPNDDWSTMTILRTNDVSSTRVTLQGSNPSTLTETFGGSFILEI